MFSPEQISEISRRISDGDTPEQIASTMGLSLNGFRAKLANSGYRVATRREIERIEPVAMATAGAR